MMTQPTLFDHPLSNRKPTLQERFDAWVAANEDTIILFLEFARKAQLAGHSRYGIAAIVERVRWERMVEKRESKWKINNDYRSRLARLLVERDPRLQDMFETRKLASEKEMHV